MTTSKLIQVLAIFGLASVAWAVLGHSVTERTTDSRRKLGEEVGRMFGPRIVQVAPRFLREGQEESATPPDAAEIQVSVDHEDRNRGLVWFSTYHVDFDARYRFQGGAAASEASMRTFQMDLPTDASIDALQVEVDGQSLAVDQSKIRLPVKLPPDRPVTVHVRYRTSGQDAWEYRPLTSDGGLREFRLALRTNFDAIDYPATGLSPTVAARPRPDGQPGKEAVWEYTQMLPAHNHTIGVVTPHLPDAGPLSARIALFAPVSLFFFFGVMVVIQVLKGWRLHPLNYLFVAAGFFAFHILLAYLVDHLSIHASFWIAAGVSVFLVVSYLRLVLGARAAILVAGAAQLVYLVFFSYAFFWQGWTGLTVVLGAVLTLFILMQLTGRIDWEERLREPERSTRTIARSPAEPS